MSNATKNLNATGRRRTATANATIVTGKGDITINGRDIADYFITVEQRIEALRPLEATENRKKLDITVQAKGGGLKGQAGATSLAIARALLKLNPELRPVLKTKGLLTRDPRMKERKKSGQPGARKRFQFSKR